MSLFAHSPARHPLPAPARAARACVAAAVAVLMACDGSADPELPPRLEFSEQAIDLGTSREGRVVVRNAGGQAVGPVELVTGGVRDPGGSTVPGVRLAADPSEIPTLNPGTERELALGLVNDGSMLPGSYDAVLTARAGDSQAVLAVRFTVLSDVEAAVASIAILAEPGNVRMGDVVALPVEVRDGDGALLQGVPVRWSLDPASAGLIGASGQFVAYQAGGVTLTAAAGNAVAHTTIEVAQRGLTGSFTVAGRARELDRHTSDLWLHGGAAYAGTWGSRQTTGGFNFGNELNVWDVSNPSDPAPPFSLEIDARTVNDVKVRADGSLAIITHEGSNDGLNGITLLDLSDPLRPTVVGRFTNELQSGVHNVWIDGDYAYLVVDGIGNGLRVLDVSDPAQPVIVARYWAGDSFLHDVLVRDGLAFLSHWNAGLVILDVGHGIAGGSPQSPVEVSRLPDLGGQTHNAWYWPEAGYVFVGEEDFTTPGVMHVVDVRNLLAPREVATFAVPGQTPHNFWLNEASATLYLAWYGNGLRALDVSGDLLGELDRQGREIAGDLYNGGFGTCDRTTTFTCTWAPQLHDGLVWVADMNEGLIALTPPR